MSDTEVVLRVRLAELAAKADECRRVAARMRQRAMEEGGEKQGWWTELAAWMDARAEDHGRRLAQAQRELNELLREAMTDVEEGDRVELIRTNDPFTALSQGSRGTVRRVVDDIIDVAWDSGSTLSLVVRAGDRFRVVEE